MTGPKPTRHTVSVVSEPVAVFVLRVWLPDRPGGLGAVASRVGAVGGDVVGIEIIERGGGRAVDDLVVEIPGPELLELLLKEVNQVDGVDVEDVRAVDRAPVDLAVAALEVAARVASTTSAGARTDELLAGVVELVHADWVAVADPMAGELSASVGAELPSEAWIVAFAAGVPAGTDPAGVPELVVSSLGDGRVLVAGRSSAPFRTRERDLVHSLARLA